LRDDDLLFLEAVEYFAVEQFVAQLAIEGFAVPNPPREALDRIDKLLKLWPGH
jgi:hypothetical protein